MRLFFAAALVAVLSSFPVIAAADDVCGPVHFVDALPTDGAAEVDPKARPRILFTQNCDRFDPAIEAQISISLTVLTPDGEVPVDAQIDAALEGEKRVFAILPVKPLALGSHFTLRVVLQDGGIHLDRTSTFDTASALIEAAPVPIPEFELEPAAESYDGAYGGETRFDLSVKAGLPPGLVHFTTTTPEGLPVQDAAYTVVETVNGDARSVALGGTLSTQGLCVTARYEDLVGRLSDRSTPQCDPTDNGIEDFEDTGCTVSFRGSPFRVASPVASEATWLVAPSILVGLMLRRRRRLGARRSP